MSLISWAESALAVVLLVFAGLARMAAASHRARDLAQAGGGRTVGDNGPESESLTRLGGRVDALSAELLWAALLASSLLLGAHAFPALIPGAGWLTALTLLGFAALVLGDALPAIIGERRAVTLLAPGRGGRSLAHLLALPFSSLASHLARARPPVEPAARHEEKLLQKLLDATTGGEASDVGETAVVRQLLGRVLHLRETPVESIMRPRSEIIWIGHRQRPDAQALLMRESGHSRIPVCGRDLDDVIGILHLEDVFLALHGVPPEATAGAIGREPGFVDHEAPLSVLLASFRHQDGTMSLVRDAQGRVIGLVTLSDVVGWLLAPPVIIDEAPPQAVPQAAPEAAPQAAPQASPESSSSSSAP